MELDESITLGLLTVLERLSPVERAVFVLHEAFGFSFDEIASIVGRTSSNCRQIGRRARERVQGERPRFDVDREQQHRLTRAFVDAAMHGSVDRLAELLHDDVVLTSDGGAERRAARHPIRGAHRPTTHVTRSAPHAT